MEDGKRVSGALSRVSIGIPTLNRRELLLTAVESVLHQTHENVQITVVDNASEDGTTKGLNGIRDDRIRVIQNSTTIPRTENYNIALGAGDGEYVAILADDDEWHADFLAKAVEVLDRDATVTVVHCGYEMIDAAGSILYVVDRPTPTTSDFLPGCDYMKLLLSGLQRIEFTGTLLRREALPAGGFVLEDDVADDIGLLLRTATKGRVALLNEPLVRVRLHDQTVSAAGSDIQDTERYHLSLDYRLQCRTAKLRFLDEQPLTRTTRRRLRRRALSALRRHQLVGASRALRRPADFPAAWRHLVEDTAHDRLALVDPVAWKFALAAYLDR